MRASPATEASRLSRRRFLAAGAAAGAAVGMHTLGLDTGAAGLDLLGGGDAGAAAWAATAAPAPSLVVTAVGSAPAAPALGAPVRLSATVTNRGRAGYGGRIQVRFSVAGAHGRLEVARAVTPPVWLGPGHTVTVTANRGPRGRATWVPTVAGVHRVTATVDGSRRGAGPDPGGALTVDLRVGTRPTWRDATPPPATVGATYRYRLAATGATTYTVTAGTLPAGLVLDPTSGVVAGTPSAAGTAALTVSAANRYGTTAARLHLTVSAAAPPPPAPLAWAADTPPPATAGTAYRYTFTTTGGATTGGATGPDVTFTVADGALPAGLVLAAGGVLSGTPAAPGSAELTVAASDGTDTITAAVTLAVDAAAPPAPTWTAADPPAATGDLAYRYAFAADGATGYAVTAGAVPPGLALADDGLLAGRPTQLGTFAYEVTATGAGGQVTAAVTHPVVLNVGVSVGYDVPLFEQADHGAAEFARMAALGLSSLRFDGPYYDDAAPVPVFYDSSLRAALDAGLAVDFILDGYPDTGGDLDTWLAYVTAAVSYYAPLGVHSYEVVNEANMAGGWDPDGGTVNPAAYMALLGRTYAAVKAADPAAVVAFSGLAFGIGSGAALGGGAYQAQLSPTDFLAACYAAVGGTALAGTYCDVMAGHPYTYDSLPSPDSGNFSQLANPTVVSLRSIMDAHGDGAMPIWANEYGAPTGTDDGYDSPVTEAAQAQMYTGAAPILATLPSVTKLQVFTWSDSGSYDGDFGLNDAAFTPKPALAAVQSLVGQRAS